MKGLIFVKKLISGLLALTIAGSGAAMSASAISWRNVDSDNSSITLKWNAVSGADGYRVYRYDVKDDKYVTVKTVGGKKTFVKVTGLKAGASYKYVVKPFTYDDWTDDGVGSSHTHFGAKSAAAIGSTKPTSTKVNSKTRSSAKAVRVFWNKYGFKNNVDKQSNYKYGGYNVYCYDDKADEWVRVACVSGGRTNVRVTGFKKNKKYSFKVVPFTLISYNGDKYAKEGDDSNIYSIKTKNYWCNC